MVLLNTCYVNIKDSQLMTLSKRPKGSANGMRDRVNQ